MLVYNSFDDIDNNQDSIITLGTFDGVHLGHQSIIKRLLQVSESENLRQLLITFEPHPQIVLKRLNSEPVKLLTTIEERIELLSQFGLENLLIIPFNYEFSQIKPEDFIRNYLVGKIGVKRILIGYDHLFGKDRQGDLNLLNKLGDELGFLVDKIDALTGGDLIISSTKIRQFIQNGEIEKANQLLGFNYIVRGKVSHGQGKAAKLGFPTANIRIENPNKLLPALGVYFVSSNIDGKKYYGMANLGYRPTLTNDTEPTLEINYFDFDRNIYGIDISVEFINFIRKEQKFSGIDNLLKQIANDKEICLTFIENQ